MCDKGIVLKLNKSHLIEYPGFVQDMLSLIERYSDESGYDYTFSRENAYETLVFSASSDSIYLLVYMIDGQIVGFCVSHTESGWMEETIANMHMFYMSPEYRNYYNSLKLLKSSVDLLESEGVKYIFAGSISRINDRVTRGFHLLLERLGFVSAGSAYVKEV